MNPEFFDLIENLAQELLDLVALERAAHDVLTKDGAA